MTHDMYWTHWNVWFHSILYWFGRVIWFNSQRCQCVLIPAEFCSILNSQTEKTTHCWNIYELGFEVIFVPNLARWNHFSGGSNGYVGRCTAPLLVDRQMLKAVSNDSEEIVRMIVTAEAELWEDKVETKKHESRRWSKDFSVYIQTFILYIY